MDTVVVFTRKNIDVALKQGGIGDWVVDKNRVARCAYVVAVANAYHAESRHLPANHCHAFLIGRVAGTMPAPENPGRWIIRLSEYAEVDIPGFCHGQRNPVRFTDISEFAKHPDDLEWKPFPTSHIKPVDTVLPLTIEEAKRGIAKKLMIAPECIEIIIRA